MKKSSMTAVGFRSLLIVIIVFLIGLSTVGFYFAQGALVDYAKVVSQAVANSTSTGSDVQSLKKLQSELSSRQDAIVKASSLVASVTTYQTQSITDINAYAAAAGITISNYSFSPTAVAATAGTPASMAVTLTLKSPLAYTSLLTFLKLVETNLPKMQVASLNLTRVDSNSTSVQSDLITVDVYTK